MTTPPDRSVEEIVRNWLEEEKKDNYVDIYDLNQVTLDGYFSLSNLIESLTSLHTQGFEAGRREERERILLDIANDPEIPIPRPYEVAWIMTKLQHADALATLKHPNVITNIHENQ